MEQSCPACGARLLGDVQWRGQCLTPLTADRASAAAAAGYPSPSGISVLPRPARLEPATAGPPGPPDEPAHGLHGHGPPALTHNEISSPDVSPAVDRSSIRTAVAAIVLGAVVHALAFALARTGAIEPSRAMPSTSG